MNNLFPIFVQMAGRLVTIIGGGQVAQRKVGSLLKRSAKIRLISPEVTERLAQLGQAGKIEIQLRRYRDGDLADSFLVIAACNDPQVNRQVYSEAQERHLPCNVVDVPELCSFQVPAVIARGDLQIAISTNGAAPALAKKIREELELQFDESYIRYLQELRQLRQYVKQKHPGNLKLRESILREFVQTDALEMIRNNQNAQFKLLLEEFRQK